MRDLRPKTIPDEIRDNLIKAQTDFDRACEVLKTTSEALTQAKEQWHCQNSKEGHNWAEVGRFLTCTKCRFVEPDPYEGY